MGQPKFIFLYTLFLSVINNSKDPYNNRLLIQFGKFQCNNTKACYYPTIFPVGASSVICTPVTTATFPNPWNGSIVLDPYSWPNAFTYNYYSAGNPSSANPWFDYIAIGY